MIKGILDKKFSALNLEIYISLANWAVDIDEHKDEIECLFSMMEDEFSKKTLQNIFLARLKRCVVSPIVYMKMNALCDQFIGTEGALDMQQTEGFRNSPQTYIEMKGTSILPYADQYFRSGLLTFSEEEVYVDAGAFDGDTVKEFSRVVNYHYKSIYAFEPDTINFGKLQDGLADLPKDSLNLICAGVSDKAEEIPFEVGKYLSSCFAQNAENFAKSVKIDEYIKQKVTFIKMDVEGFEGRALLGTRRILETDSPKLAICLYHKPADIWEIPLLVKKNKSKI